MNPGHTESHAFTTPHFGRAKQVTFPHPRYPYHLLPCAVPHRRRSTSHPWSRLFPPYRTRDAPMFDHRRGTLCPVEDDPECCSDRRIPALPSCPDGRPPPVWPQASGPNTKARNRGRNGQVPRSLLAQAVSHPRGHLLDARGIVVHAGHYVGGHLHMTSVFILRSDCRL